MLRTYLLTVLLVVCLIVLMGAVAYGAGRGKAGGNCSGIILPQSADGVPTIWPEQARCAR